LDDPIFKDDYLMDQSSQQILKKIVTDRFINLCKILKWIYAVLLEDNASLFELGGKTGETLVTNGVTKEGEGLRGPPPL